MITKDTVLLLEKLSTIEKKLDSKTSKQYFNISQVSQLTSLSQSTIRREVARGHLKCSKRLGKLLFKESDIQNWLNG